MALYAEGTTTSESKSKVEIDELLRKHKAAQVAVGEAAGAGVVYFALNGFFIRFNLRMPTQAEAEKKAKKKSAYWSATQADKDRWIEGERRRRWRALLLTIKAKLVSVENSVESFEEAFLAHLVIEGGQTVGQRVLPAVAETYKTGKVPAAGLLGSGT